MSKEAPTEQEWPTGAMTRTMLEERPETRSEAHGDVFSVPADPLGKPVDDIVNHPPHYTQPGKAETISIIEECLSPEEYRGYLKGQIVKYLCRMEHKLDPATDAGKLAWYARELEEFQRREQ